MRGMRQRAFTLAAGVLLALGLSGCATTSLNAQLGDKLRDEIRARGLDPEEVIVPFHLTPEMETWLKANVQHAGSPQERLKGLLRSIVSSSGGLGVVYQADLTITAEDVFRTRKANCLAFTNLFVGLARELGVEVYFLLVEDLQSFAREGDLVVISDHMTAAFGKPPDRLILDFTPGEVREYRETRELSDLVAVAMYYTNRGAGFLRSGDERTALGWLETAVKLAPELAGAWTNLGVARRRTGDLGGAEIAYRRALETDPSALSAYQNLAALLRLRGQEQEANELLALTARRDNRNPYTFLDLGDLSLRYGRLEEAEGFYRRALRLDRDSPEPYAAIGLLRLSSGDAKDARSWLRKARGKDPKNGRVLRLERQLERDASGKPLRAGSPGLAG